MYIALQVITVVLAAVTMGLSLAHALELPGKLRLNEAEYRAVQTIYYPGFTFGGLVGELGGLVAAVILALLTPWSTTAFGLIAAAAALLAITHLLYWVLTHPVNGFWLADVELGRAGGGFFGADPSGQAAPLRAAAADWTALRDRWERSHVARAVTSSIALVLLVAGVALSPD